MSSVAHRRCSGRVFPCPPIGPTCSLRLLTFVVERTVEVVAASVEAGSQLDEVASPRVASTREAGQGDELLGLGWEKSSVHAAVICKVQGTNRGRGQVEPGCEHHPCHCPATRPSSHGESPSGPQFPHLSNGGNGSSLTGSM